MKKSELNKLEPAKLNVILEGKYDEKALAKQKKSDLVNEAWARIKAAADAAKADAEARAAEEKAAKPVFNKEQTIKDLFEEIKDLYPEERIDVRISYQKGIATGLRLNLYGTFYIVPSRKGFNLAVGKKTLGTVDRAKMLEETANQYAKYKEALEAKAEAAKKAMAEKEQHEKAKAEAKARLEKEAAAAAKEQNEKTAKAIEDAEAEEQLEAENSEAL